MLNTITLRGALAQQLLREAEHQDTSIEELVNDWLEDHLWEQRCEKIREESERYESMHGQLRALYADRVIAMRDGQVVDIGDDLFEVHQHVREKYGNEAILITKVGPEPVETYMMRSPRLVEFDPE